jgi:hypothetical protein
MLLWTGVPVRMALLTCVILSAALRAAPSPPDPCTVLKLAEVQVLAGGAKVEATGPTTLPAGMGASCRYTWGVGANAKAGRWSLDINIGEAAKLYPGMGLATLKEGFAMQAKLDPSNASLVPGVGEAAVYSSATPLQVNMIAYVKGQILQFGLEGPTARMKKDPAIGLLKTAAGRL